MFNYLFDVFKRNQTYEALIWQGKSYSYASLYQLTEYWMEALNTQNINAGDVVVLEGDYSPNSIALFIALAQRNCVVVPVAKKSKAKTDEYIRIAQAGHLISINLYDDVDFKSFYTEVDNQWLLSLKAKKTPGLIIFSSGSTGKSKASVHDFTLLLKKFQMQKKQARVIAFLLFDHIGGINTLFYTLFNAGCLIITDKRSPKSVCELIEKFRANALTTTPTFLNLLLISGIIKQYDLSSLFVVNYGTEVMPETTLKTLTEQFPSVRFSQAYGLSEVGVLPVKSKSSNSLFIKIDDDGYKTRIVDGLLEIKSESSMLGYLNAPQPFTEDGWFKTGDAVESDGDYLRVLGRKSELINVGGEKVYPAEIENILEQLSGVEQASVSAEYSALTGQMVVAKIRLNTSESLAQFRKRLHDFCKPHLPRYKIPQKIILTNSMLHNDRFKKIRHTTEIHNEI